MRRPKGGKREGGGRLPLTPMIDIIFNLLVFFLLMPMITAGDAYLTTRLPQEGAGEGISPVPLPVRIELRDSGRTHEGVVIVLNDRDVLPDFQSLQAALKGLSRAGLAADHPVLIAPTMAVRHKWVVRAFDAAVLSRFTNIRFAVPRGA